MARKIITSVREQYDKWFRENVACHIPTTEEVQAAKAQMLEGQKKYETVKSRFESYKLGLLLAEKLPAGYLLVPKEKPSVPAPQTPLDL